MSLVAKQDTLKVPNPVAYRVSKNNTHQYFDADDYQSARELFFTWGDELTSLYMPEPNLRIIPHWWTCKIHGDAKSLQAWACPECMRELREEASRLPKMISVSEQMPPNQLRVLIAYTKESGKTAFTIGWHCTAKTIESASFDINSDDEYDEETDTYYLKEQWVDESEESEFHYPIQGVTHWMPLKNLHQFIIY